MNFLQGPDTMWGQDLVRNKENLVEDFLEDPVNEDIIEVSKEAETADLDPSTALKLYHNEKHIYSQRG